MSEFIIRVKAGKCQGHARCYTIAPEIFELDEEGYIGFVEKRLSETDAQTARQGVWACPEQALELVGDQ
jgi:ferredoxin